MEIFRGHFQECFTHFCDLLGKKIPKNSKNRREKFVELAKFCGVGTHTIATWVNNENNDPGLPKGSVMIKLMFWLDLCGYKIIELERMEKPLRSFFELIGYGIVTAEESRGILCFSATNKLYDIFWSKCGYSDDKKMRMWDYWKSKRLLLDQIKTEYFHTSELIKIMRSPKEMQDVNAANQVGSNPNLRKALFQMLESLTLMLEGCPKENLSNLTDSEVDVVSNQIHQLNSLIEQTVYVK